MKKALVACFSASGVTAKVALRLANAVDADLFEISPVQPYSEKDLKWTNPLARCNKEKIGKKDVPVSGKIENFDDYGVIFVGFPIWYYGAPNIIVTFLKSYDLAGKKIALFATSGGSDIGKTADKLRAQIPGEIDIVAAKRFLPDDNEEALRQWASPLL
ncbi:MAG: flavodoxin [Clostridia bacterium]|nr:flavodoxin [Clostridia bacterium]MBR0537617.1 flavodoxin [Clostridia bacterium]